MAEFVSTTTPSAYADPSRAFSIKALEKRLADAQAANAQNTMPDLIPTPIQGIGHLANQLASGLQEGRLESKAAAARAELSQLVSGYNPDAPDAMATVGKIGVHDPQLAATLMSQFHETARDKARYTQQSSESAAERAARAASDAASIASREKVSGEELAARREEFRLRDERERTLQTQAEDARKSLEEQKIEAARQTGHEQQIHERLLKQMEIDAKNKPDMNAIEKRANMEREYSQASTAIERMHEAQALLKKGTVDWGQLANIRATGAVATGYGDQVKAQDTIRFNQLMQDAAITQMAARLKGQTTNFEMQKFVDILNDPRSDPAAREKAIGSLMKGLDTEKLITGRLIQSYGGDTRALDDIVKRGGAGAPPPPAPGGGPAPAPTGGGGSSPAPGGGAGGGGPAPAVDPLEGRTITGPNNAKMIRRGGKWEPM